MSLANNPLEGKLAKQAEAIRNYQKQVLVMIKHCLRNSQINSLPE